MKVVGEGSEMLMSMGQARVGGFWEWVDGTSEVVVVFGAKETEDHHHLGMICLRSDV